MGRGSSHRSGSRNLRRECGPSHRGAGTFEQFACSEHLVDNVHPPPETGRLIVSRLKNPRGIPRADFFVVRPLCFSGERDELELLGSYDEHPDARPERGMTLVREQVPPGENPTADREEEDGQENGGGKNITIGRDVILRVSRGSIPSL